MAQMDEALYEGMDGWYPTRALGRHVGGAVRKYCVLWRGGATCV